MCLDNYMSIRGECETATMYLDDLPGINIVNVAESTNGVELRPIDLVKKAFNLAQSEVLLDIFEAIKSNYNKLIDNHSYKNAGNYRFFGETTDNVNIKIYSYTNDSFVRLHIFGFELVCDRDTTKDFVITDGYGVVKTLHVNLVAGLNVITLDEFTNSEFLKISFDLVDLKVGIRENEYINATFTNNRCSPCQRSMITGCAYVEVSNSQIGFNLNVRCEANECKILQYLVKEIEIPLLYKTGINYLLEVKMSGRINSYTRNKMDDIEEMLTYWMGGYDREKQAGVSSLYKKYVKAASHKVEMLLANLNSVVFTHSGSYVCNTLP